MPRLSAVMIGSVDTAGQRGVPSVPSSPRAHPKSYHPYALPSQWLAVDAGTDLRARARQIQRSWESLLAGGALNTELSPHATAELRPAIVDSWRRSLATGLDPTDLLPSIEADPYETRERWLEHPLGSLTHVLVAQLQQLVRESESLVQVTDPSGLTLHLDGVEWLKERAAEMNLVEGARCSETVNGTNGIGTALAVNHPVQVFAFEHFSHHHREWVCSGAPMHDPVSGRLVGVIDLSSPWKIAHPRSLELVTTAARTMEQCLLETGATKTHGCDVATAISATKGNGSAREPRRLRACRRQLGAPKATRCSGERWRDRHGRRIARRGGAAWPRRGVPRPPYRPVRLRRRTEPRRLSVQKDARTRKPGAIGGMQTSRAACPARSQTGV